MEKNKKRVQVETDKDIWIKFKSTAILNRLTVASAIRVALENWISKNSK